MIHQSNGKVLDVCLQPKGSSREQVTFSPSVAVLLEETMLLMATCIVCSNCSCFLPRILKVIRVTM